MKEITFTKMALEDGDLDLLRVALPINPCSACASSTDGPCLKVCPEGEEYKAAVKPYKKKGIYEIAVSLESIKRLKARMILDQVKVNELVAAIPQEVASRIVF